MIDGRDSLLERPLVRVTGLLAILAYLPAFIAAPGRMPSDSKLYLYLDPGRFLADAAGSFDPRQFAGWVPHQHVSYLWPAGPWFWLFDLVGVPDWVAHRLWIGTIMLAAGLGVRWCSRLLGLTTLGALVAALVYQLSPYVLPYVSRTSVMLLPWAGLGWIVAFSVRATRRHTWGDPAAIALIVLTVGAVNATALAMIVPAPVLWLVHAGWQRTATWREVVVVALRVGVLSVGVSLWWMAMLVIQGRHGADVLPYSESLADVSLTATSPEVWRGLGYWLFYVRDPYAATTTESLRYLTSTPAIVASFLVPLACLAGLVWVKWAHRRFAAILVATGVVLAVGVHPIDDRSPLMRLLAGDDEGGLALALRSSTRALPLMYLGLALAAGSLVAALRTSRIVRLPAVTWSHATAGAIAALALINMPGIWAGAFVDPALERDQDPPAAWSQAAEALDVGGRVGRVLQVPGIEFGAYRWGYSVDQPLPGLTEKPLVTRDLLPLGSPAAMDLLYALDDRIQDGTLEPATIAPIARLLGVDTIWLTNDIAFDRFHTARPEVVRDVVAGAPGVGSVDPYGELFLNRPDLAVTDERSLGDPRVGAPVVPVELASLDEPGSVIRAIEAEVVVSGSGDGLVDAAAAGLIDGASSVVRYSADLDGLPAGASALIVTDSNRAQARHWRSSQDTRGYTESIQPGLALLRDVASDQRLPVFENTSADTLTVAEQRGPVTATASSYGEPFAYLPEHRPYMAIDGDTDTAWLVGEHADPVGEKIRLGVESGVAELTLLQPAEPTHRKITAVVVDRTVQTVGIQPMTTTETILLDERSWTGPGQPVPVPFLQSGGSVDITIAAVGGGEPGNAGAVAGVGFAEIGHGLGPTVEVVIPPHDALADVDPGTPLALALTRLRHDPMDRWRDDPEPLLIRELELPQARTFEPGLTVRVDARASDRQLADLFGWPVEASSRLEGSPRHAGVAAFDGDPETAWTTAFGEAVGATVRFGVTEPVAQIAIRQPITGFSRVTALHVRSGDEQRTVELVPDAFGGATATVSPELPAGLVEIEIAAVESVAAVDRRFGDVVELPAALSEITVAGAPLVAPLGNAALTIECMPVADVDGDQLLASITVEGQGWLDGDPVVATPCAANLDLAAGAHLIVAATGGLPLALDRLVLDDRVGDADRSDAATATVVERTRFGRRVEVAGCTSGCWLVLGEGYNEAWAASITGSDLGPPVLLDGGFNGWWIEPAGESAGTPVVVDIRWTAQRPLTLALWASLAAAAVAICLVVSDRRRGRTGPRAGVHDDDPAAANPDEPTVSGGARIGRQRAFVGAAVWVVVSGLLVGPGWAVLGAVAGVVVIVTRRAHLAALTAMATVATIGAATTFLERRDAPFPGGGWPTTFESLHGFGMFAAGALAVAAVVDDSRSPGALPRTAATSHDDMIDQGDGGMPVTEL